MSSIFQLVVDDTAAAVVPDDIENCISTAAPQDTTFNQFCAAELNKPNVPMADRLKILEMIREREEREREREEREREREERREVREHLLAMAKLSGTRAAHENPPVNE